MDHLQRQSCHKSFNSKEKDFLANEKGDKAFSLLELFELENLITKLENVADKLDLCANNDVETVSMKSQQDKQQEYQQGNSQLTEINENFSNLNTLNEFAEFNLSVHSHLNIQQEEDPHKNLPANCLDGVQPYTSEAKEDVNYITTSDTFESVCEPSQAVINESDDRELTTSDYKQTLFGLYQNEQQNFTSSSTISSDPATSDSSNRNSLFNSDVCMLESRENNNLPSSCLLGIRPHASEAKEKDIVNYFTTSSTFEPVCEELQSVTRESHNIQSITSDYMQNSFELYEQNRQQKFNSLSPKSSDNYTAMNDDKNQDAPFNIDTSTLDLHENNNEINLKGSTNIPSLKDYSGNLTLVQKCDNSKSSSEVVSHVNGKKSNEFVNKDGLPISVNGIMNAKKKPSKKRRVICKVCGKSLYRQDYLAIHIRYHTGEKPYACKWCERRFVQQCDLTRHLRTHTGEKPYKCPICGKYFASNRHYKQKHYKE